MGNTFLEEIKRTLSINTPLLKLEEVANNVAHPVTNETITKYKTLIDVPLLGEV